ncbi:hypothetical protein [Prosthecobacter sp.]|uniref:hypothetical protein n=1 Tax=Prosthecobacter sp. TaxID=1965333 RepID=UPI002AB9F041|nr:hypothetical protein [Prosthecobacter sp.]MDZ4403896.1 hypothetical protein [Prosthecobacter sp.]
MSTSALDTKPQSTAVAVLPEFADHRTARALFGLSRSHLYILAGERKIRSVSIRKKGALKGRRLFDCASIREFLQAEQVEVTR